MLISPPSFDAINILTSHFQSDSSVLCSSETMPNIKILLTDLYRQKRGTHELWDEIEVESVQLKIGICFQRLSWEVRARGSDCVSEKTSVTEKAARLALLPTLLSCSRHLLRTLFLNGARLQLVYLLNRRWKFFDSTKSSGSCPTIDRYARLADMMPWPMLEKHHSGLYAIHEGGKETLRRSNRHDIEKRSRRL